MKRLFSRQKLSFFQKGDLVFLSLLLLLAAGLLFFWRSQKQNGSRIAVIRVQDKVAFQIDLEQEPGSRHLDVTGSLPVEIEIMDGAIAFTHSTCPDQICVHTGFISRINQFAACLPAGVSITIEEHPPNL